MAAGSDELIVQHQASVISLVAIKIPLLQPPLQVRLTLGVSWDTLSYPCILLGLLLNRPI